jgi:hypothetical protein
MQIQQNYRLKEDEIQYNTSEVEGRKLKFLEFDVSTVVLLI